MACGACGGTGYVHRSPDIRDRSKVPCGCCSVIPTQKHEFLSEGDIAGLQAFSASLRKMTELEDKREQSLLQVMLLAKEVCDDAGQFMHQEATHYLVDKEYIDRLREALLSYTNANETYLGVVDGIEATPSTPEM